MNSRIAALLFLCILILLTPIQLVGELQEDARSECNNIRVSVQPESLGNLTGKKICIDPGHGGSDSGALGPTGYEEKVPNLDIALRLRDLLVSDGATVIMTRDSDIYVSLSERCRIANDNNTDIFFSVHNNAYNGNTMGTLTLYWAESSTVYSVNGKRLATLTLNNLVSSLGTDDLGAQGDKPYLGYHLYVLNRTNMPASLAEVVFIDNATEEAELKDPAFRQAAAEAMHVAICRYFGVGQNMSEMRGLWAARWDITNQGDIDTMIQKAKNYNFNAIFFQVRGEGYTLYNSAIEPKYPSVDPAFDPLAYAVNQCHQNGLEIHAWLNCFNVGTDTNMGSYPPEHVLKKHPEWICIDNQGNVDNSGSIFLDPGTPDVQNYTASIYMEVAMNYDVDGVHFDYIRYEGPQFSYTPVSKARFKAQYGYDPPTSGSDPNWNSWRENQVTAMVEKVYSGIMLSDTPYVEVGAAVWGRYDTGTSDYFQAWHEWMREGLIDYVAPMTYYSGPGQYGYDFFNSSMADHVSNRYGRHIYSGIGAYKFPQYGYPAENMVMQVDFCRSIDAQGVVVFSYSTMRDYPELGDALLLGSWAYKAGVPPCKYSCNLSAGWNLVSMPFPQYNATIQRVFRWMDGKYDCLQAYDPLDSSNHWREFSPYKPDYVNGFSEVNHTIGIWVHVNASYAWFAVSGTLENTTSVALHAGWNLVGYPSFTDKNVTEALKNVPYTDVYGYNGSAPYRLSPLGQNAMMSVGNAFWIEVSTDCIWIVNN